jgi:hypothetical protein
LSGQVETLLGFVNGTLSSLATPGPAMGTLYGLFARTTQKLNTSQQNKLPAGSDRPHQKTFSGV